MYSLNGSPELLTQALDLAKRADLQNRRDWCFDSLLICTAIVAVGLFMEGPEIFHDLYGIFWRKSIERRYWLTPCMYRREYRAPDRMKVLTAVGWLLIVLGVIGEFASEGYVNKYDAALQTMNDAMVAEATREAGEANKLASENNKQAQQLKAENLKLEALIQPRTLSIKQQQALADACKPFAGYSVTVFSFSGDAEGARLGGMLIAGLKGIRVEDRRQGIEAVNMAPPSGVLISGDPKLVRAISDVLNAAHIARKPTPDAQPGTHVTIQIGVKPFDVLP